jgi:hypothetical protein
MAGDIAPPIKHCRKDADRDKKYQGTKAQTGWRPSSFCNAEIFYLCQVFLARFSWGSNIIQHIKGGRHMKHNFTLRHTLALLTALTFIPLFLSGKSINGIKLSDKQSRNTQKVISCDAYRFTETVFAEELKSQNPIRIIRCDSSQRLNQPKFLDFCFYFGTLIRSAVGILFITIYLVFRKICHKCRYIIKYIHDQDGFKIIPSFY